MDAVLSALRTAGLDGQAYRRKDTDRLPDAKGCYALAIQLDAPVALALPHRPETTLQPGIYVYCGSAKGSGGLKARIGRHLATQKKSRWHVDQLTLAATDLAAVAFTTGSECELVETLRVSAGFAVPMKGFGSSDCRTCDSHLFRFSG